MDDRKLLQARSGALTWDQAENLFRIRCEGQNLAPGTLYLYKTHLAMWTRWARSKGLEPASVTPTAIRAYLRSLKARGLKDNTVDCVYRILKTFWRFLVREEAVEHDPMARVERPRREQRLLKVFTEEQVRQLLDAIGCKSDFGKRDYALILLLADTGLRLMEALSLKRQDVDLERCVVTVCGKGRKERLVPFGQAARRALVRWIRIWDQVAGGEDLWISKVGSRINKRPFQERLAGYGRKAGLQGVRCSAHTFRHFFAVTYLRNGGDVLTLQRILGHSTLDMTRVYARMADSDVLRAHRAASPLDRMGVLPGEKRKAVLKQGRTGR